VAPSRRGGHMSFITRNRLIFIALATGMIATRVRHFDVLPDASWAILFLGGFYLRGPLAFSALMLEAVAIDYVTTQHAGVSSYCLSPAYAMLLPAYGALWLGGLLSRRLWRRGRWAGLVAFAGALMLSMSFCFLLSNGGFYWLSGHVASPNVAGWLANFRRWYPHFVLVQCLYAGVAVFLHIGVQWIRAAASPTAAMP
jgi:hypothetical protein